MVEIVNVDVNSSNSVSEEVEESVVRTKYIELVFSDSIQEASEETQSKVKTTKGFFDDYYKDLSNYLVSREQRYSALISKLNRYVEFSICIIISQNKKNIFIDIS